MEAIIGAGVGAFLLMLAIVGMLVYVRGEKKVKIDHILEFVAGEELQRPRNGGLMFAQAEVLHNASQPGNEGNAASQYGNGGSEGNAASQNGNDGNEENYEDAYYGNNEYGNQIYGIGPLRYSGNEIPFGGESFAFIVDQRTGKRIPIPSNHSIFLSHRKQRRRRSRKSKRA